MKDIIDINIKIVKGEDVSADVSKLSNGLEIETLSPKGIPGGYTVSACCDSNKGKSCSSGDSDENACGMKTKAVSGEIQCDGKCSAKKPSKPSDDYCDNYYYWNVYQPYIYEKQTDCVIDNYGE
jgi:hypothetical protein